VHKNRGFAADYRAEECFERRRTRSRRRRIDRIAKLRRRLRLMLCSQPVIRSVFIAAGKGGPYNPQTELSFSQMTIIPSKENRPIDGFAMKFGDVVEGMEVTGGELTSSKAGSDFVGLTTRCGHGARLGPRKRVTFLN